jgi:hypothetical protein
MHHFCDQGKQLASDARFSCTPMRANEARENKRAPLQCDLSPMFGAEQHLHPTGVRNTSTATGWGQLPRHTPTVGRYNPKNTRSNSACAQGLEFFSGIIGTLSARTFRSKTPGFYAAPLSNPVHSHTASLSLMRLIATHTIGTQGYDTTKRTRLIRNTVKP